MPPCAVSAAVRLLHRSRRLRTRNLLGRPTYLALKDKGENSMLGKRLSVKVCTTMRRKSCTHEVSKEREVKPGLAEPQFPAMQLYIHRSIPEAMTPYKRT